MKKTIRSFVWKALRDQSGQTLPFVALAMTALLGAGGLVVDVGHAYVVRGQLQNSANAAALAAAGLVYTQDTQTVNTTTEADLYGATGTKNPAPYVVGPPVVVPMCLKILMPKGSSCVTGGSTPSAPNAVKVTQTAKVPTFLMAMFGVPKLTVSATAIASMQGSSLPWNVAIIIDSTGSMASVDSNCNNVTQFQCALGGVQALLGDTNPCPPGVSSCSGTSANVRMSLFTFPNVLTSYNGTTVNSVSDDINCGGTPATWTSYSSQPIAAPYTLPIPGATLPGAPDATYTTYTETSTGHKWNATYQITPFLSDYYSPANAGDLNPSSSIVKAVGHGSTPGCLTYTFGIWGTGSGSGFGNTYTASAIYAAQSALTSEQVLYGGQNALILLSDGGVNASYYNPSSPSGGYNKSAYGGTNSSNQYADANEFPSAPSGSEVGPSTENQSPATGTYPVPSYYTPATSTTSTVAYSNLGVNGKGVYPDWYDQCQQTIQAGQYASSHSTTVFSVAYGAGSSGCSSGWSIGLTDTTLVASATGTNPTLALSSLTPCVEMENVASSLNTFYSDYMQGGTAGNCVDSSHSTISLSDIFQAIATTFATPQLLPNNAT